jgi:hypothetical protein
MFPKGGGTKYLSPHLQMLPKMLLHFFPYSGPENTDA